MLGLIIMERVMGIEPTRLAWKARALPMSYTRMYRLLLLSYYTLFLYEVQVNDKRNCLPAARQGYDVFFTGYLICTEISIKIFHPIEKIIKVTAYRDRIILEK